MGKRKALSSSMAILLAVLITACGGGGSGRDSQEPPVSGPSETDAKDASQEKPRLRALLPFERFDPNLDPVAQYLKDTTGYDVKYEQLPAEEPDEKLNLLMANKEPYDYLMLYDTQFYKLVSSGALEPLDELIEQYGANMKKVISEKSWNKAKYNGKIYAIPQSGTGANVSHGLVMRQDWMDELGLQPPKDLDQFYELLKTIKEKKQVIPLTGGKNAVFPDIALAFGITTVWKEQDGKLIYHTEDPAIKEYLVFMNKLYEEGLIDSEWPINTMDNSIQKMASGKAAMMSISWWSAPNLVNAFHKNFPDTELTIFPYMQTKDGISVVQASGDGVGGYAVIPKFSKNKEETMKYLDMKFDADIFKGLVVGEEGVHHTVENGKYYPVFPKFFDERNNSSYFLTGVDEENYPTYWQARLRKDPIIQHHFETYLENAEGIMVFDPITYAPPIEEVTKNVQKLAKMAEDMYIKIIGGADSIDNYDKFLMQWRADGGEEMMKAANEWYQEYKKQ
ncbi:extracellular solute-binding protein [Paenibacillus sp. J2TS4]|uniref:extracellular solute-binding protein n=1 Tax=Paenibacillus sp. J2TS4 TaxID=2807194 RepID=UPI001B23E9FC|nr:extracellular solute-binding protein [Paenibacillus sp. J2TS4]GIP32452.1 lipoprotein LipO [Paenibacillus sp. J2TS4]